MTAKRYILGWDDYLRYFWVTFVLLFNPFFSLFPPFRNFIFKLLGAKVNLNALISKVIFINYTKGLKNLSIGANAHIAMESLLDVEDKIIIEDEVTVAERVIILTHFNAGYADHPMSKEFPFMTKEVVLKKGCFIGAGSTILPGVVVGEGSMVAAGSVVTKSVEPGVLVAGVPAVKKRSLSN